VTDTKKILVTHINIRQSISILLAKIVTVDAIAATLIAIAYFLFNLGIFPVETYSLPY